MKKSPCLLALDLSTPRGALAVVRGDEVLFREDFTAHRAHNARLFEPLRLGLQTAGFDLTGVIVGTGPGSYTGVRIAIATAQGISMSRGVPVFGVPSILAPAAAEGRDFCVVGDARRESSFVAEVRSGQLTPEGIQLMPTTELQQWANNREDLPRYTFDEATSRVVSATLTHPCPVRLAQIAAVRGDIELTNENTNPLEPIYLRDAFITQAKARATRP